MQLSLFRLFDRKPAAPIARPQHDYPPVREVKERDNKPTWIRSNFGPLQFDPSPPEVTARECDRADKTCPYSPGYCASRGKCLDAAEIWLRTLSGDDFWRLVRRHRSMLRQGWDIGVLAYA